VDESTAPCRNFLFVCERPDIDRFVSTMEARKPLETPCTPSIDIWQRGDRGMILQNKLDICHHYEINGKQLDKFVRDAASRGIETNYYPADGSIKKVSKDGHYLFLCNGGTSRVFLNH
jgi:hypothetical protein